MEGWARSFDRLLVHVDADVLDFLDFPIAEETRRYRGLRFEQLVAVLRPLVAAPNWTTLTICEVNPDHDPDRSSMRRLSEALGDVLSGAAGLRLTETHRSRTGTDSASAPVITSPWKRCGAPDRIHRADAINLILIKGDIGLMAEGA